MLKKEAAIFTELREFAQKPLVLIMGGDKVATKIKAVESMLNSISVVCFGGVIASSLLAAKGIAIDKSITPFKVITKEG